MKDISFFLLVYQPLIRMNNKNYRLKLEPLIVKPVSKNLVFEIGQCSGSYDGKYILVWGKDVDGMWKIIIDSNI